MNILHLVRQFYPCVGGIESFVLGLSLRQMRKGHKVEVLTLDRNFKSNCRLPLQNIVQGIPVKRIPFLGSKRYPIALSSINYLRPFDIIHVHAVDFFIDYLVLTKCFHKKKLVLSSHGGFFHTKWLFLLKEIYFNTVTKVVLRNCDKIIANSINDYNLFKKVNDNVIRIDNAIDIENFGSISKNIEKGLLVYIGRLDIHKRIDNLLITVATLIKRGYQIKLKIIGPDWKGIRSQFKILPLSRPKLREFKVGNFLKTPCLV